MNKSLSKPETKEVVTPYAFTVSEELLGKPLASPMRRGVAIVIDVFLISVLSSISALIFAVFVALTFFRADVKLKQNANNKSAWYYTRLLLRSSAAVIVFATVFLTVESFDGNNEKNLLDISGEELGLRVAQTVIMNECKNEVLCVQNKGLTLSQDFAETTITLNEFNGVMKSALEGASMSPQDFTITMSMYQAAFTEKRSEQASSETGSSHDIQAGQATTETKTATSIIEWVKVVMSDLGLGLGWAALYFSVFTAWANGQTIGKKICGIKVVKLDGSIPNLWESFGRYGGYGAGFATGLLGFLQLYWDPNRQAIQDKISETLVLRNKKN